MSEAPTMTLREQLREQRAKLDQADIDAVEAREAARAEFEARENPTEDDVAAFAADERDHAAARKARAVERKAVSKRIDEQKDVERSRRAAAKAARDTGIGTLDIRINSEPLTYNQHNAHEVSYFADLAAVHGAKAGQQMQRYNKTTSLARLEQHAREMDVEMPKIEERRRRESRAKMDSLVEPVFRGNMADPFRYPFMEQRVTPNRVDGQGGYFVAPLWWNDFIRGLRPARVTAALCQQFALPTQTDVIVVPKLSTLTSVDIQGADNAAISNTDWTDTAVTAPVRTLAGFSDVPVQLLEQSQYPVDQMIIQDLLADYDKKFDLQILAGSGSAATNITPNPGGQVAGLYSSAGASPWTSYNGVTYTDGSPSQWKLFSAAAAMFSKVATNRFLVDSSFAYVAHPRRTAWWIGGTDTTNRPLIEQQNFGPFNVQAVEPTSVPAQGMAFQLPWGPRVYHSANVTTSDTAGGGTGQDILLGVNFSDAWAFEGQMHTDVFSEVLSGTLGIRFRVYAYCAFLVRYGQSIAVASGSGFAAPTGAVSSITF